MTKTPDLLPDTATADPAHNCLMQSLDRWQSWQPQLVGPSGYGEHLHVLGWLVSVMRPRQSVGLGIDRGVAYFALCQAASEAGFDAQFSGIDVWHPALASAVHADIPDLAEPDLAETLLAHNQQNYANLSRLICADPSADASIFDLGGIDLLLVDQDLSADLLSNLRSQWCPLMSSQGVIVLRGTTGLSLDAQTDAALQVFSNSTPHLALSGGSGLLLLLVGDTPSALLQHASDLPDGSPERAALEQQFYRLGAPLRNQIALKDNKAGLQLINRDLAMARAALSAVTQERDSAAVQIALLQSQLTNLLQEQTETAAILAETTAQLAEKLGNGQSEEVAGRQDALNDALAIERSARATSEAAAERLHTIARLSERDAALADRTRDLEESQSACDALSAALDNSRNEVLVLTRIAQKLRAVLVVRGQEHKATLNTLAERDIALVGQARQLEESRRQRATLAAALENSRAEVAVLTAAARKLRAPLLHRSQEHAAALTQQLDAQAVALAKLKDILAKAKTKLGLANAALVVKEAEILALHNSTSWKLTAPLRRAKDAITRRRPSA